MRRKPFFRGHFFPSVICPRHFFFYQSFLFCQGDGLFAAKDLADKTVIGYYWGSVLVVADMLDGGFPTHEQYTQVCREQNHIERVDPFSYHTLQRISP